MTELIKPNQKRTGYAQVFFYACLIIGLFTSHTFRALPSISIIGLLGISLLNIDQDYIKFYKEDNILKLPIYLVSEIFINLYKGFKNLWKEKAFLAIAGIFVIHVLSTIQTDYANHEQIVKELVKKFPLIILPLVVCSLPSLKRQQIILLLYIYLTCLLLSFVWSFSFYATHFNQVNDAVARSKPFPVPVNHVRFSLMVCFGFFTAYYIIINKLYLSNKAIEKLAVYSIGISCFVFLHFAMVRSGILCLYTIIGFLFFRALYLKGLKRYIKKPITIVAAIVLFSSPYLAYKTIPTIKNKVDLTIKDFDKTNSEVSANFYSLTARIYSYKAGLIIWKENPYFGLGIANLKRGTDVVYIQNYPLIEERILPHNQYIMYAAAFGTIGLCIFLFLFYYSGFKLSRGNLLLSIHFIILSISFMFEGTLETQLGINFSLAFITILPSLKNEKI